MGDIEEKMKRKWEAEGGGEEEEGAFKKSNKVTRSPEGKKGGEDVREILREMGKEMREGLRGVKQEIREMAREQREALKEEINRVKEELRRREERWNKEKEDLQEKIDRMEREMEVLKIEGKVKGREGEGGEEKKKDDTREWEMEREEWKERVKRLERRVERKERGERRNNIIVKGIREGERDMKGLERVWKKLGVEVRVESIKEIRGGGGSRGGMWLVRVGSEEERRRIIQSKWKLKGEEIRIEEDLT